MIFLGIYLLLTSIHFVIDAYPISRIEDCLHSQIFWPGEDIVSNIDCVEFRLMTSFDESFDLVQFLGICFQTPDTSTPSRNSQTSFPPTQGSLSTMSFISSWVWDTVSGSQDCASDLNFMNSVLGLSTSSLAFTQMKLGLFLDFWWNW